MDGRLESFLELFATVGGDLNHMDCEGNSCADVDVK